jgi:hypothetical protein
MNGRVQITREKQRLADTFKRASALKGDAELSSDMARYLCVLVSGFLEQVLIEVLLEHTRQRAHESVQNYVGRKLRKFTTANAQNITDLIGSFDPLWGEDLRKYLIDEYKDAVDSVVNNRHAVAHGRAIGITMSGVQKYYEKVVEVVDHITELCLPLPQVKP